MITHQEYICFNAYRHCRMGKVIIPQKKSNYPSFS